jgi:RND family efflux transporter MFP subunit
VTAPFDGVITARLVEPGDLAAPGTGLFAIEGTRHFEVEVAVPDSLPVPEIDTSISMVLGGRLITGHLHEASPAANPASRTRLARIRLPAETVNRSGHYAKVRWPDQTGDQITVPSTAVTAFGQMKRVFVVAGNQAQLRLVRTGAKRDGRTIVLAGLNPDETIIIVPPTGLRDGQPLQLTP